MTIVHTLVSFSFQFSFDALCMSIQVKTRLLPSRETTLKAEQQNEYKLRRICLLIRFFIALYLRVGFSFPSSLDSHEKSLVLISKVERSQIIGL